jgi:hypothetical protein
MFIYRGLISGIVYAFVLSLSLEGQAGPMVLFGVEDLGGGFFQYDLTLNNNGGVEPLSGLLVVNGGSVFGLDASSNIGAPQNVGGNPLADWSFISPFPPFVDILSYFSLDSAGDVPINGSLGAFFFQSSTNPSALSSGDFAVIGIGGITGNQIPLGNALFAPEPSSLLLAILALVWVVGSVRARDQNRRRATRVFVMLKADGRLGIPALPHANAMVAKSEACGRRPLWDVPL